MAELKFNLKQAEAVQQALSKEAKQITSIIASLNKDINQVESWWKGDSQGGFIQQYKRFEPSLKELSTLAEQISQQMAKIASIKAENEKKIAGMFK